MAISIKKYLLLLSLLILNNSSFSFLDKDSLKLFSDVLNFLEKELAQEKQSCSYPQAQQQKSSSNSPKSYNNQSLDNYLKKLANDLSGLPTNEINDIIEQTKNALNGINLNNLDRIENIKRSVLVDYCAHKISLEISAYEVQNNIKFDQDIRNLIQNNRQKAFINHIQQLETVSGNNIKTFFGDFRQTAIQQACKKASQKQNERSQQSHSNYSSAPAPAAPPAPMPSQSSYAQKSDAIETIINLINKNKNSDNFVSNKDLNELEKILKASNNYTQDTVLLTKEALTILLNKKLNETKQELTQSGSFSFHDIENAINKTLKEKTSLINKLKTVDSTTIAEIIGTNRSANSNNIKRSVERNLR